LAKLKKEKKEPSILRRIIDVNYCFGASLETCEKEKTLTAT